MKVGTWYSSGNSEEFTHFVHADFSGSSMPQAADILPRLSSWPVIHGLLRGGQPGSRSRDASNPPPALAPEQHRFFAGQWFLFPSKMLSGATSCWVSPVFRAGPAVDAVEDRCQRFRGMVLAAIQQTGYLKLSLWPHCRESPGRGFGRSRDILNESPLQLAGFGRFCQGQNDFRSCPIQNPNLAYHEWDCGEEVCGRCHEWKHGGTSGR